MSSIDRKQLAEDRGDTDTVDADLVDALRKELVEAHEDLFETRRQLQQQHEIAAQVHRSLLPAAVRHPRIDVDVRFLPAEPLGSDYFQVRIPHDDSSACYITMCHVDGEGVAPALLASRISSEARHFIEEAFSPADMIHALNLFIYEHLHEANMNVSFMAARIDMNLRTVAYSGADHPGAILLRPDQGIAKRLPSQHTSIGMAPEILNKDSESTLQLSPEDRLLFFAEGITRGTATNGQPLGQSGLAEIAAQAMTCDLFEMFDEILEQVHQFRDGPAKEDVTLVVAGIK